MIEMKKSCAFTGHRPSGFVFGYHEQDERCLRLKRALFDKITALVQTGTRIFYTGMAEGVDIWAAEAVLTLCRYFPDIELMAVLPFRGQRETMKADYKTRYDRILEKASEQILICEKYTPGCYKARNYFLVEQSDALLAVYSQSNARSGTGQTVRRALAEGKEVHFIDPAEFC